MENGKWKMTNDKWKIRFPSILRSTDSTDLSEERQSRERLADEIVELVRGWRHDGRGARIAEIPFHADFLAESCAAAQAHRQIGDFGCDLACRRLTFENPQHRVCASVFER